MADDEGATVNTLTECREIFQEHVQSHKGRIVDTAGDSVLATFESVVEAVEAAVEIQRDLAEANEALQGHRKMHFRIGVNLGDIIVREDGTIYGDGVNVAARLEGLADPSGVMLSDIARQAVEGKLAVGLEDAGEHEVKNIATPVKAFRVLLDGSEVTSPGTSQASKGIASRPKLVAGLVAVLAVVVGVVVWSLTIRVEAPQMVMADGTPTDDPVLAAPTGPAIAVLPFDDLSEESEQAYFADGLTEEIITGLSRFNNLRVIARNSTFQYKGQAVDVREVGEALGVRYVLEGSVRRAGDTLRVTAQLLDARDGTHLWAENYARDLTTADIFAVQDSIMERIVGVLGGNVGVISRAGLDETAARHTDSLTAYECVLRAYGYYDVLTPAEHLAVRSCLEEAVALDPTYAEAWGWLSHMYQDEYKFGYNPRPDADDPLSRARTASQKAIQANATSQIAYEALASAHYFAGDLEHFRTAAERALSLNPNNSQTLAWIGSLLAFAGDWDRGVALTDKAVHLNPNHPTWYHHTYLLRHYGNADFDASLISAKRYNLPNFYWHHSFLAMIYAQLGRLEEARASVTELTALYPGYAEAARADLEKWFKEEALVDAMKDGLEKAGLFDQPEALSRPVIAVLPFENMSGDPEQEYFADGIAEGIINALSQFDFINVISRTSTFQFRDKTMDVRLIGDELNANYILTGSLQRSSGGIRVSVQLIDAADSNQIWSDVYDGDLSVSNIFELQDNIVATVAAQVGGVYGVVMNDIAFALRGDPEVSMPGYECILRAAAYYRIPNEVEHLRVRDCLEQTVSQDPGYATAWQDLTYIYLDEAIDGYNPLPDPVPRSFEAALTAVRLEPHSAAAHIGLAWAASFAGDWETNKTHIDEAFRLNSRDAWVLNLGGLIYAHLAEWEKSLGLAKEGRRLNPLGPGWLNWVFVHYYFAMGDYEQALSYSRQLDEPDWHMSYAHVASALGHLGRLEEARAQLSEALKRQPDLANVFWQETRFFFPNQAANEMLENFRSGLQKVGLEVPEEPEVVQ
jgi:adenylate cyclase